VNLFKTSIAAVAIVAMATSGAAFAATVCKDSTGKIITCPAKPATPAAKPAAKPAPAPAAAKPAAKPAAPAAAKPATTTAPAKPAATTAAAPKTRTASASKTTAIPTKADGAAPAGAGGKCKDGTYSMSKSHSGACARHGGVAYWIG